MIDTQTERLIRLSETPQYLPRKGRGALVSVCTVRRWHARGVRGHKLETVAIGGLRYTSHEALRRFIASISGAAIPDTPSGKHPGGRNDRPS